MKNKIFFIVLFILPACTKQVVQVETFEKQNCKYVLTGRTNVSSIPSGCSMYANDANGQPTSICLAATYNTQILRETLITCNKTEWK